VRSGRRTGAVVEIGRVGLEVVEPDQGAVVVAGLKVPLGVQHRLHIAVVEVIGRGITPARNQSWDSDFHASDSTVGLRRGMSTLALELHSRTLAHTGLL
jgi:hypothetical protein